MLSSCNRQLLQEHLTSGRLSCIMKWHVHQNQTYFLNNVPSSFWLELLVIVSFLIFNATFSSVFISRWRLSGLAFKTLSESQSKSLSIFFFKLFNYFIMFKIIGVWRRVICIICRIYIDTIKEQIANESN